jgi:hypothetical protein
LAAQAFGPSPVPAFFCDSCVCAANAGQTAVGVWCYSGSQYSGLVGLFSASDCTQVSCPLPGGASTFPWN